MSDGLKAILIVEDDEDIQEIYKRMIQDTFDGVEIVQRLNGAEGLKAVNQQKPSLILLDLLMPVMNGEEFLSNLRHKLKLTEIPVVICSVNQSLAHRLLKQKEANAVLPKVFSLEDLVKIFDRFLGLHPKENAPGI